MATVDYIKFVIKDQKQIDIIWSHPDLIFCSEHTYLNKNDGELKTILIKNCLNLKFKKHDNHLEVEGSLHKFHNLGLHNANDFTVSDCIKTIYKLCKQLHINPLLCQVNNLEFGINIVAPISVSDLVKWLRFHHKNQFIKYPKLKECFFAGSDYFGIKAYNKTLQYPQYALPNLFRFEGKTREAKYLNRKGINTLKDLTNPSIYSLLSSLLLSEWDNVLLFDKRAKKHIKFCNTDFWLEIQDNSHRNTFLNTKNIYYKKLGEKGLQHLIRNAIKNKLLILNDCANSTCLPFPIMTAIKPKKLQNLRKSIVHIPTKVIVEIESLKKTANPKRYHRSNSKMCTLNKLQYSWKQ